ncbi:hypothetical protein [Xanthomonas phage JGB6]|nr:hypothetical protein [Xanthomonas phage JGB6]
MGKTYRREKQHKGKDEGSSYAKRIDHNHERTERRRNLHDVKHHWTDPSSLDDVDLDNEV